jgi:hypothetical protein
MALLDATNRARTVAQWMRENIETCTFTKADLAAAVAATDTWVENNTAAFVAALPLPFRTASTATQKTLLFCYVLMRRAGKLKAQED